MSKSIIFVYTDEFSFFFSLSYVWSGLIVVFGIYLNVYSRNQAIFNAKIASLVEFLFGARFAARFSAATPSRTLPI
jgi:hypothetical protein